VIKINNDVNGGFLLLPIVQLVRDTAIQCLVALSKLPMCVSIRWEHRFDKLL